jgi:5-methylcytosine-specific restriction endonuclease McrA
MLPVQDAKESNVFSDLTPEQWLHKVEEYHFKCYLCGCQLTTELKQETTITLEHIIPIKKGGTNTLSNVAPACFFCNNAKRNKTLTEFKDMVHRWRVIL